jgi:four helix bundle protein
MDKFTFFDLRVYQEAKELVKSVYTLLDKFPKYETYALGDQLRRAVTSVPSNIAEGSGRFSIKEKIHFIEIAYGSLTETLCQLDIANDLNYITDEEFANVKEIINVIVKQLSGLRASFQNQLETR